MEQLEQALEAIYNPATPNSVRSQAQQVCEQFTQAGPHVPLQSLQRYAALMLDPRRRHNHPLRHFFLSAAVTGIERHWDNLPADTRAQLQRASLELLASGTNPAEVEARYIKEKCVAVVVSIALRTWPQQWSDLLERLHEVAQLGETQAELFAKVVLGISQGAVDTDFNAAVPPRRRSELMRGLQEGVEPSFLPLFYAFLDRACGSLRTENPRLARLLCCATLKTVLACLDWMAIGSVMKSKVFPALKEISKWSAEGAEEVQLLAWKCLSHVAGRKQLPVSDTQAWIAQLLELVDVEVLKLPRSVAPFAVEEDNVMAAMWPVMQCGNTEDVAEGLRMHDVHKEIARFVNCVSTTHFAQIWREINSHENLKRILSALMVMLDHPSLSVRKEVLPGIAMVVKTSLLRIAETSATKAKVPVVEASLMHLLRILADNVIMLGRPSSPAHPSWPTAAFTMDDFDDDEAFAGAFYGGCASTKNIIKEISRHRSEIAIRFFLCRIAIACGHARRPDHPKALHLTADDVASYQASQQTSSTSSDLMGSSSRQTKLRTPAQSFYLATCTSLAESVLSSMPNSIITAFGHQDSQQAARDVEQCLELLMRSKPSEAVRVMGYVQALARFKKCFHALPIGPQRFLGPALMRLFECVTFRDPSEQNQPPHQLSADTLVSRRKACTALIEVCSASQSPQLRAHFAALLPTFCDKVLETIRGVGVNSTEEQLLNEVLVVVSNNLETAEMQAEFIAQIVSSPLAQFLHVSSSLTSAPGAFFSALTSPAGSHEIAKLYSAMSLLLCVSKRSVGIGQTAPFARYWTQLLPPLLAVCREMHLLWARPRLTSAGVDLATCPQRIYYEELRALLGKSRGEESPGAMSNVEDEPQEEKAVHLLAALRDTAYGMLAISTRHHPLGLLDEEAHLKRFFQEAQIEVMEHRHVAKLLAVVVTPVVKQIPAHKRTPLLFPILSWLIGHCVQRLKVAWEYLQKPVDSAMIELKLWGPIVSRPSDPQTCEKRSCGTCTWCEANDIARDASIRVLGNCLVDLISLLLGTFPTAPETDTRELKPQELCNEILLNEAMATCVLSALLECMLGRDASTVHKAVLVFQRIFYAVFTSQPQYTVFITDRLVITCLQVLLCPRTKLGAATDLETIQLVQKSFAFLMQSGDERRLFKNFLHVPGVTEKHCEDFVVSFKERKSVKGQRHSTKIFLQECAKAMASSPLTEENPLFARNKATILDLPTAPMPKRTSSDKGMEWFQDRAQAALGTNDLFKEL